MENEKPIIYKHISLPENVGQELDKIERDKFFTSVALEIVVESVSQNASPIRLISSDTICVMTKNKLILVPIDIYPKEAEASREDIEEAKAIATTIGFDVFVLPLSFASLTDNPELMISGADYLVKKGNLQQLSI